MIAHLKESIQGLNTIRAYCAEEALSKEFDKHQVSTKYCKYDLICIYMTFITFIHIGFAFLGVVSIYFCK